MLKTRRMANRYRNLFVLCITLFLAYELIFVTWAIANLL